MWPFAPPTVTFEQAVYGTFPFWDRGYDVLARSPGCRAEWIRALRSTCPKLGERPRDARPPGGLVSRWLDDGTWMVVGPSPQGRDDRGRPDAVAFHALFLDRPAASRAKSDPFRLAPALRSDWGPDATLSTGRLKLDPPPKPAADWDERAALVVKAFRHRLRVVVASSEPIDRLAEQVWLRLSPRSRARHSLATWAYRDAGAFDLLGLPRLTGIDPEDPNLFILPEPAPAEGSPPVPGEEIVTS